ncbi:MAG: universal stress protein [Kiloniellaceae bacterium]
MDYKNLLVYIDDSKACAGRIEAAMTLARAHEAHLTGLYVSPDPYLPGNLQAEVPREFLSVLEEQAAGRKQAAVARFTEAVEKNGLSADCRTARGPASSIPVVIGLHARYADLVVLGQAAPEDAPAGIGQIAEEVVLSSGRPVLVVPYIGPGKTLGKRIMVAWDAGREAARAVSDALPILERADQVVVLAVNPEGGTHGAQPGADVALYLARHGVKVEAKNLEARDITIADALLSHLSDLGVDLLVMGAYGHSRLRELILGGVTRAIFEHMTVPVLMAH